MHALALELTCIFFLAIGHARPHSGSGQTTLRSTTVSSELITSTNDTTTLSATVGAPAIVTLDYGHSVEGIPTFEVVSIEGDTSVFEITYAESLAAFNTYMVRQCKTLGTAGDLLTSYASRAMGLFRWQPRWIHIESIATM